MLSDDLGWYAITVFYEIQACVGSCHRLMTERHAAVVMNDALRTCGPPLFRDVKHQYNGGDVDFGA